MAASGAGHGEDHRQRWDWWAGLPAGLRTDVPVLVAALACWATLSLFWAHVVIGLALGVVIGRHLQSRRPRMVARIARRSLRTVGHLVLGGLTVAMATSGVLRLAGVAPQDALHSWASYGMLTALAGHVIAVRRVLVVRLGARRPRTRGRRGLHSATRTTTMTTPRGAGPHADQPGPDR